ncbi:hypothetical protein [Deinococcus marmoris]|uniref:Uncharacterized protein n=1 Tax=Deinococcus marmoris TaxID=249408 RepID=A0A1U7NRP8_9DEIO|nr:hypothetical protein [Deinococcus marmoris]OLV15591.1 hypothetical protein BOO71_0014374 [Deinococcus marmoris]
MTAEPQPLDQASSPVVLPMGGFERLNRVISSSAMPLFQKGVWAQGA